MKRKLILIAALLAVGSSAWCQAVSVDSYIKDLQEALVNTGSIDPWSSCHHLTIDIEGGWGYAKIPDGVERQPDESSAFTYAMLQNNVLSIALDLAEVDEDQVKTEQYYSPDRDLERALKVRGHQGLTALENVPVVYIGSKKLNGLLVTRFDLAKLRAAQPASELTQAALYSLLGAKSAYGNATEIWFGDKAHQEAFKVALQKAAIVCRAQP
jgi:hypothetical protein